MHRRLSRLAALGGLLASLALGGCSASNSSKGGADRISADPSALISEACDNTTRSSWLMEATATKPQLAGWSQIRWSQTIDGGQGSITKPDGSRLELIALPRKTYVRSTNSTSTASGAWVGLAPSNPQLVDDKAVIGLDRLKAVLGNCKPTGAAVSHDGGVAVGSTSALQIAFKATSQVDVYSIPRFGPLHVIALDFSQDGGGHVVVSGFDHQPLPQAPH